MQLIDLFVTKDKDSESYVRHYMTHLKPGWAFELWRVGQLDQRLHHKIEMCVLSEGQLQAPKHGEWFMSLFGEVLAAPPSTPTPHLPSTSSSVEPHFSLWYQQRPADYRTASLLQALTLCTVRSDLSVKKPIVLEQLCVVLQCYCTVWCIGLMDNQ